MQRKLWLTGILAAALASVSLPLRAQAPQQTPTAMPALHGPMPKPKNLQVLPRDISHADLMKVMHGFSGALGVKCSFCHAAGAQPNHLDFASDAKPEKQTARTMMRMTQEINDKFLSQVNDPKATPEQKRVTCGTCHGGHEMPAVFVPPPESGRGRPGPTTPQAHLPNLNSGVVPDDCLPTSRV